jgi:hypothetical protein
MLRSFHSTSMTYEDYVATGRVFSYDAHVFDYDAIRKTITLYPKWRWSQTTIHQVSRFLRERFGLEYEDVRRAVRRDHGDSCMWEMPDRDGFENGMASVVCGWRIETAWE